MLHHPPSRHPSVFPLQFGAPVEQLSGSLHSMLGAAARVAADAAAAGEAEGSGSSSERAEEPAAGLAELAAAAASLEAAMAAAAFPAPPVARPKRAGSGFVLPTWMAAHGALFSGRTGVGSAGSSSNPEGAAEAAPNSPAPRHSLAAFNATLLPHAVRLAAALLPHWPLPEQRRADRLELARAVLACRPGCSNLRCPDWQRQCKKTLLCAGRKKARFCNAACQAEAWRHGGHKHVCRLLAAAGDA